MSQDEGPGRKDRLAEFFRRLLAAPLASNHDEALQQVTDLLNQVEDEMTTIPFDPSYPRDGERMYPPLVDNQRVVSGRPDLVRYRSKRHILLIGTNGAIRFVDGVTGPARLSKPGADGRTIEGS